MRQPVRVIPCLDVNNGRVVKGVNFENLRDAGDPVELAHRYQDMGADELTFLDVSATVENRGTIVDVVRRTAEGLTVPLTVGGGVRSVDDARALIEAGAAKVGINSAAIANPQLIADVTAALGPVVSLAVDARTSVDGYEVVTHGGTKGTGLDAVEWARRGAELGAAEILLTSMDADGTTDGFDVEMLGAVRAVVEIPIIASGGAGNAQHFVDAVEAGADAVLAASVFHFGTLTVDDVKNALRDAGIEVY